MSYVSGHSYGASVPSIHMRSLGDPWRRRAARERAEELVAFQLVLEHVHPGNLGALPPSPDMLRWKARQLGLI